MHGAGRVKKPFESFKRQPHKCSNTPKQFVCNSRRIALSVFNHFVELAPEWLMDELEPLF